MTQPSTVNDCMHRQPLTIRPDANLVEAVGIITEHGLTGLTVTDASGAVQGVLSELDCLRGILAAIYNDGDPEHALVSEVMTCQVNACGPQDSIVEVAQSMLETRQRRRPVVENGVLVGQVSSRNILWALMEHSRRRLQDRRR
ncbi:CBS domain-containing protein [Haliea sp.]|jgi:CBS domain-containing protein|uniref:CBS domain-containing protein n=1 Tax=Haliea sp. TaxID=1932666 RepID=UPI0025C0E189|nr:CBS domain-containing protein [Haliea sp.]|tara:strand:+ start:40528 stop:40956 length:429 start_codon:yes stop_codon:yes gene_type:complete